ncbi:MAG: cob(I)yrinic acid a,c-diamide adenosyltransferase [Bacteroidetes bacterium]|nr:MAG: cob(I)yrinic acid a,c-diamide adenosyltransferase [Bacteroidota bacterium]MBL1144037.1 cob(I)yrinic acid a,c-diamide adenosyltransferase [Bacteroidota bacterium]NOG56837.1 cob(I)yrinic acid a,c-diamide adenosyltransferase [Bacteroidota bacterium]
MKIYTKKGDLGKTGLIGGTRVSKHHIRIESYGTVDELNSYIGLIRDQAIDEKIKADLIEIQDRLFTLGSLLAADPEKSKMKLPQLSEKDVTFLENKIDAMDNELEVMKSFVLPGGHTTISFTHIARCVCRRAERNVVLLAEQNKVDNLILQYLNRLSDYLFTLSRKLTKDLGASEQAWEARI